MGETYENTTYMKLSTGNITQRYLFLWDLAFASDSNAQHIMVNGGKEVQVHATTDIDFSKNQTAPEDWTWDNPNGSLDSTAFGNCFNSNGTSKQEPIKMHLLISMVMPLKKVYLLKQVQVYG